jgi:hypothetical protein
MTVSLISKFEVAQAFGKTVVEFESIYPGLKSLGFPDPTEDGNWYTADLLTWVTNHQEMLLSFVSHISDWLQ